MKYALFRTHHIGIFVFLLLTMATISAHAEAPTIRFSQHGLAYVSGGIGIESTAEMRKLAKKFTLNLLFSEGVSGQSASDVNVNIYDENSHLVFRIIKSKPMLYVNLPTGTYTILANNQGEKLRYKLRIEENTSKKIILNWKQADDALMQDEPIEEDEASGSE